MPITKGRFQICQNPNYTLFKVLEKHLAQDSLWGKVSITKRCKRLDCPPHALYKLDGNKKEAVFIGNKNGDYMIEAGYDKKCSAHNEDT